MIRLLGACLFGVSLLFPQIKKQEVQVRFDLKGEDAGSEFLLTTEEMAITDFRCYLTSFRLLSQGEIVVTDAMDCRLLDLRDSASLSWTMKVDPGQSWDEVQFYLGVDSATSVSGAFGGDLDPMHGMYWSWQSGYINLKLEGRSMSPAGEEEVIIHLGGYQGPNKAGRWVSVPLEDQSDITIEVEVGPLLRAAEELGTYLIMSPGQKAAQIADRLPQVFTAR